MTDHSAFRVPGYLANGVHVGIKNDGRRDLALLYSTVPAHVAGVFTTNAFKAAPVLLDMERIGAGAAQAVIANSGCANAATGEEGLADARRVSRILSETLGISDDLVQVASTGVIGHRFDVGKIERGMEALVAGLNPDGIPAAEEGIMTTDRFPKLAFRKGIVGGREVTLCGMAKGAGMIEPHMATMLAFVMTDAAIDRECLDTLFRRVVGTTFNAVSVDGCMSTNDTALILANGVAGNRPIARGSRGQGRFAEMLTEVTGELARAMVRDGEGATKCIELNVEEAANVRDARRIASAVANSNLVKAAFFGGDPNWGRIISAAGSIGIDLPVAQVRLFFEDVPLFAAGKGVSGREADLSSIMARPEIRVRLQLGMGHSRWRMFFSDLTFDYVKINAHYHT